MRKRLRLKKMVSALLAVAMIGQSCLVTTAGDLTDDAAIVAMQEQAAAEEAAARKAAEEKAAQEAAAQKAAEEKAAQEAAAAQKAAEEAAAQKAAEEAAAQKAAEEAAAQKAAEEAAAQKAAEEAAAQEAAAAQKAAEEAAAQKAAEEAAAQKAAEEAAAAQKAAEDAAAQKAAEDAAAQKAAEEAAAQEAAAAQKAAEEAAAQEKAAQEITYRVTFEAHATDYGSIYVRGESGPIASVSSYYKEVKENGSFAFTIHANDGYEVEHVRYADTNAELPKNAQGAYEIAAVTRNVKVVVTYKIVPQETADAAVETEADEGQTEAPTDEPETEEDREAETEVGTENATEESTEAESEYETEPGTEAESETESESEEEILMPEFHYNGVCNGIAVAIRAPEGVFPEGTKAVLAAPSAESLAAAAAASGQDASDLMGVDITFRYDGKEIQPTSAVEVSFRAAEIADADISNVYHVSDGGAVQKVAASKSGASLGFTADSFSTWIFPTAGGAVAPASILDPETSIATYVFTADGETVDTQYITSGDTLSEPAAPVKKGHRFIGWYVGEIPVTFGTVSTVSETAEIIVEARFEEVYYVFFHHPDGAVVATKEGIAGAKITTSDVTFAVGAEESITGWYYSGSAVESVTLSDSNVDLYAKVEKGFWVTYDSDGGSYVAPEFYPAGETAALSAQPTKNGYSFEGWYDGDAIVTSTTTSVSVKAKWKENSRADYRVIYWQQKVTDDKNATNAQKTYAYVATETKTGRPGTTVNASSITKSYAGFTKNTVNSKSVTIAADGSTIMNVYYDRVLCTVKYYVWRQTGWVSGEWELGKTVTGLYGANLKEGEWWTDYYWYTHKNGGNGCILLTSYDFKTAGYANNAGNISSAGVVTTCNFYGTGKETGGKVYYYNEQADGSFKLVNTVDTGGGTLTIHQKYAGYDLYKYTTGKIGGEPTTAEFWKDKKSCKDGDSTDKKTVHIASKLQSFRLDYSNGGEVQHHETVKYTASLNGYDAKFTPTTRPATVDANYTFDGWYSDPECTKKFDFNTTMPAANVVVYAGWKAPEVRVTAHRSPEDMLGVNVEAAYGESVDEHLLPTISYNAETQEFLGWFTRNADGSYRPWDFSTKIYSDVDLYARVISKGTFKVSYYANGGTGTVEDGRAYAQGAKADVKAITGITAPTGKTFLYWSLNADGSGKKYYPNNTIEIEGNITLYAIWGDTTTTSLTYHGNGGATSDDKTKVVVSGLKNNQKVKAAGAIFARTGYKFIGWSTNSEATAAEYVAGADVIVHADETVNVLYAVWETRNDYQYTVHYYWNDTTEKVAEDKVVLNQTYNETITESPIAIKGYTPVNSGSQEMVIDAENKTLIFYYYKNVGLTANSDTKVYNGQEQSVSGFTGAPEGADFSAVHVGAKGTNAGEYPAAFAEGTIGTVDKTKKYIVTGTRDGKLEITPVADEVVVTIEGNHDSKVYDGTEHVVTGYEVTGISNVLYTKDNFSFSGNAEAKRTAVGKTDMGLTAANFKNESANFSNVTFKVTDGYMEITPAGDAVVVTIVGNHDSAVYDGTEHKVTGYVVTAISNELYTEGDFDFSGTAEAKRTEAGTTYMGLTAEDFVNKSANFSKVIFNVTDGYMEITPVTEEVVVTIEGNHDSKVYDGEEHKVTGYKVTAISNELYTEGDFDFIGTAEAKRTEAGTTMMGLKAEDFANKSANFSNVTFKVTDGYMEITPVTEEVVVTIEGNHDSKVYDGTEHVVTGYEVTGISNVLYTKDNFSFSGNAEAKRTAVGKTYMGLTAEDFVNKSANFSNVTFKVTDGYMEITPAGDAVVVTIVGNHDSAVYDGTEHEVTGYVVTAISNELYTEGDFDFIGTAEAKRTEAGTTYMGLTAEDFVNKSANFSNVTFKVTDGYMEITPVTDEVVVTIVGNHDSKVYDGTEHEVTGYDVTDISNPLYEENDIHFSGNAEARGTNADTYEMGLSADDFTNTSSNFINVRFDVTDGFLKITKREVEFTANSASKAYDGKALTDDGYRLTDGSLAENQNETVTVVGSQTLVGSSDNEITEVRIVAGGAVTRALGEDVTDNYAITTIKGTLTVTDGTENDPVDPGKVVTKTHEDAAYDLGETVTFTISVTNIYDTAKTITITELPGVAIEGADASKPNVLVVTNVPAGETITATATYTITWQDIANGSFVNTVKAEFSDGKPFETTDTVTVVDPVYDYTMEKTAKVPEHESGMVKEGETIGYTIRVQNTGNQPLEEIRLTDTLNAAGTIANIRGAEYVQDGKVTIFTIRDLQPNQTITITYEYVVLDADKGKTISNAVVGPNPTDPEKPGKEGDTETTVEDPKLEVNKEVKAITAADGTEKDVTAEAALNDIITYTVTVKNTGNVVLIDVHVADSLEGIKLAEGQSFEFRKLEAGETQTITYTYQVQEKDLGSMIVNKATATAKVPEDPEDKPQPKDEDEKEVPTEDRNPSLKVEKEVTSKAAAEDGRYIAGETITYKVTVTNNGNLTLKDVVLKDVLTRANGTTVLPDGWESDGQTIGEMAPGATRVFEYSHKVTEEDLGGVLKNAATASGEPKLPNPDPEKPEPKPEGEDEKEVPTEDRKPSLKAEKKVTSKPAAEDGKYTVGETITYEVTVTNTGNLTLKNIHVQDIMTRPDGTQMIPSGLTNQVQTIEGLEPNASETLQYTHVVTEQDLGGELKNAVTVSGEPSVPKPNPDPDPEKPEPKPEDKTEETVITEDPTNCSIIVTKKLTNMMDEALVLDNAVFYVALFTDEGLTNRIGEVKKLTFGANQSTATAVFAKLKRDIYYVAETDENGKVITSGAYNNGAFVAQYAAGQKVEIKENGTAAEFAFANQFLVLPSEYDLSKRVTIVKTVQTKKGKELKTNETFYAGIFSDAAHTQLAENVDQNIVPLATNGTAGARNEIEVTFAPGASTTLYIAEVSADGVPVEQNAAFEYTAGIDQNVITLSEDTDDATVKITNTSKKDEPETECEDNRQSESNKPKAAANSVKTGDDTPLMTFVLLLLCSASCMMLLAGRRKKEDGQDR